MKKVAADGEAFRPALFIVALASLLGVLGYFIFPISEDGFVYRPDIAWLIGQTLIVFLANVAMLYVIGFLGEELFKSKLDMNGFIRVMGHGMIVSLLAIVPKLGLLSGIWVLVIMFKLYKELGKLETGVIIMLLLFFIIVFAVVNSLGFSYSPF